MQMETISRHAVKYRAEKYIKNKLIKSFTDFDLGKKTELKCTHIGHQTSSFISIFLSIITRKSTRNLTKVPQSHASNFAGRGGGAQ